MASALSLSFLSQSAETREHGPVPSPGDLGHPSASDDAERAHAQDDECGLHAYEPIDVA